MAEHLTNFAAAVPSQGTAFRIATFNVENYLNRTTPKGKVKSAESKAQLRAFIRAINPDVLALQEMGSLATLMEFRKFLAAEGLAFPYWEHVTGADQDLHIAVLSKFPFAACRRHANETYESCGRRFPVRRGFAEVEIQIAARFSFLLLCAHLKSQNVSLDLDASALRFGEAKLLRARIDSILEATPDTKLVVLGDFNDTPESPVVTTIIGDGDRQLIDSSPAECKLNSDGSWSYSDSMKPAWTSYFEEQRKYDRFDYILLSPELNRYCTRTFVPAFENWRLASDHRPVVAEFHVRAAE